MLPDILISSSLLLIRRLLGRIIGTDSLRNSLLNYLSLWYLPVLNPDLPESVVDLFEEKILFRQINKKNNYC